MNEDSTQQGARLRPALLLLVVVMALAGCAPVGVKQQRFVSRPNMQFTEQRAYGDPTRTASQLEPGRAFAGGAQASVCTSCR